MKSNIFIESGPRGPRTARPVDLSLQRDIPGLARARVVPLVMVTEPDQFGPVAALMSKFKQKNIIAPFVQELFIFKELLT